MGHKLGLGRISERRTAERLKWYSLNLDLNDRPERGCFGYGRRSGCLLYQMSTIARNVAPTLSQLAWDPGTKPRTTPLILATENTPSVIDALPNGGVRCVARVCHACIARHHQHMFPPRRPPSHTIPFSIAMSLAPLVEPRDVGLYYFAICGHGEPIHLILQDTGVEYTENNDSAAFFRRSGTSTSSGSTRFPDQWPEILGEREAGRGYDRLHAQRCLRELHSSSIPRGSSQPLHTELISPGAASLLPTFAKEHVSMVLKQLEHLFKRGKNPKRYFVYEHLLQLSFYEFNLCSVLYALAVGHLNSNLPSDFTDLNRPRGTKRWVRGWHQSLRSEQKAI
ncbi:hypothetical protein FOMPIDRAFT_1016027 [Fomitopsis schrenkii]|uniref:Uncharacterized protein n=1 Tax=Fomitopsis schrenkii TaxID=2126942 RepID=S8E8I4_FOMSC|nr:hypothetical protein FOMPIDRAFT_1016027 [Fomitopsis schrenkii]